MSGALLAKTVTEGDVTVVGRDTKGLRVKDDARIRKNTVEGSRFRNVDVIGMSTDANRSCFVGAGPSLLPTNLPIGGINKQEVRLVAYHQGTAQKFLSRLWKPHQPHHVGTRARVSRTLETCIGRIWSTRSPLMKRLRRLNTTSIVTSTSSD